MLFLEKHKNLNLKNQIPFFFFASTSSSFSHPHLLLGCFHCWVFCGFFFCYFYMQMGGGMPTVWNMFIYMQLKITKHTSVMRDTHPDPWRNSRKYNQRKIRDASLEASLPLKLKKESTVDLRGYLWCLAQMQVRVEHPLVSGRRTTNQMNSDWFFKKTSFWGQIHFLKKIFSFFTV